MIRPRAPGPELEPGPRAGADNRGPGAEEGELRGGGLGRLEGRLEDS